MLGYTIRDPEAGIVYFSRMPSTAPIGDVEHIPGIPPEHGICYRMPEKFITAGVIACQVLFANTTTHPIVDLRIIEEHFLSGEALQDFDFTLAFVPPNSRNTWEHMYEPTFKRDKKFVTAVANGLWRIHTKIYDGDKLILFNQAMIKFVDNKQSEHCK